jgi:hypothetical protein
LLLLSKVSAEADIAEKLNITAATAAFVREIVFIYGTPCEKPSAYGLLAVRWCS